jgi:hypothetical protein
VGEQPVGVALGDRVEDLAELGFEQGELGEEDLPGGAALRHRDPVGVPPGQVEVALQGGREVVEGGPFDREGVG